ncbi:hypothetical protein BDA96_04G114100 [Sorghum bicolor]|uniref:Peroxidase n=1 Tax=Sorghum bicolor TaxID=4558 RepID=A0A921R366_SORBI|nr:hypothetical protein BDA96_04G114100 [Sorghum bicolor]
MAGGAVSASLRTLVLLLLAIVSSPLAGRRTAAALSTKYYDKKCPGLQPAVRSAMARAVAADPRAGASVLRLFFHDCFVNGCDASVLLDDAPAGEKGAAPNANSLRGFDVVDAAKAAADSACGGPGTVSCADVLALAARDAVSLLGGPSWAVRLGRLDARTASRDAADALLPGPASNLSSLVASFAAKGLSPRDMTALSGAHTVGRARCVTFRGRVSGGDPAASIVSGRWFDNGYFQDLVQRRGLLHSDQQLFAGGGSWQDALVRKYARDGAAFASDFAKAMVRMGNLAPAPGTPLEVRINCHRPN